MNTSTLFSNFLCGIDVLMRNLSVFLFFTFNFVLMILWLVVFAVCVELQKC